MFRLFVKEGHSSNLISDLNPLVIHVVILFQKEKKSPTEFNQKVKWGKDGKGDLLIPEWWFVPEGTRTQSPDKIICRRRDFLGQISWYTVDREKGENVTDRHIVGVWRDQEEGVEDVYQTIPWLSFFLHTIAVHISSINSFQTGSPIMGSQPASRQ